MPAWISRRTTVATGVAADFCPRRLGSKARSGRSGMTLIELMVVILIIGLIMSSIIVAVRGVRAKAMKANVKGQLAKLQISIENYKTKYGSYPDGSRRSSIPTYHDNVWQRMTAEQKLFAMLFQASDDYTQEEIQEHLVYATTPGWYYIDDGTTTNSATHPSLVKAAELVDRYGNRIAFKITKQSFFIYSLGDDAVTAEDVGLDAELNGKVGDDILP